MLKHCPWFNPSEHYAVFLTDEDGNIEDVIGVTQGRFYSQ